MRGKYYRKTDTVGIINITGFKGKHPFDNQDDLVVQYDEEKGLMIMKQAKRIIL